MIAAYRQLASTYGCHTYSTHPYDSAKDCQGTSSSGAAANSSSAAASGNGQTAASNAAKPPAEVQLQTQTRQPSTAIVQDITDTSWGILLLIIIATAIIIAWFLRWRRRRQRRQQQTPPIAPTL